MIDLSFLQNGQMIISHLPAWSSTLKIRRKSVSLMTRNSNIFLHHPPLCCKIDVTITESVKDSSCRFP